MTLLNANANQVGRQHIASPRKTIKSDFRIAIKAWNVVMVMNVMPMRTFRKFFQSGMINTEVMRMMFSSLIRVQLTIVLL